MSQLSVCLIYRPGTLAAWTRYASTGKWYWWGYEASEERELSDYPAAESVAGAFTSVE